MVFNLILYLIYQICDIVSCNKYLIDLIYFDIFLISHILDPIQYYIIWGLPSTSNSLSDFLDTWPRQSVTASARSRYWSSPCSRLDCNVPNTVIGIGEVMRLNKHGNDANSFLLTSLTHGDVRQWWQCLIRQRWRWWWWWQRTAVMVMTVMVTC